MTQKQTAKIDKKVGVIADDLTGANDSGVQFTEKGLAATVIFDIDASKQDVLSKDVTVINTNSRSLDQQLAYQKAFEAASLLQTSGVSHLYKKVDSTLRGNLGAEIQAAMDVFKADFAIIAPSFPRIGRKTINGDHYLHGKPIHQTEIANDPKMPVSTSYIPDLLIRQTKEESIGLVRTKDLNNDHIRWERELASWKEKGVNWLVFDAEEDEELDQIARQLTQTNYRFIWVGSAGLAEFLPDALQLSKTAHTSNLNHGKGPVLVVAGSMSEVTQNQLKLLKGDSSVHGIEVDPITIFENNTISKQKVLHEVEQHIKDNKDIVLYSGSSSVQVDHAFSYGKKKGLSKSEMSDKISEQLGQLAAEVIEANQVESLVLTGGDTAINVCRAIGAVGMELIEEIEPGIPLGKLRGSHSLYVVTKAGAFGSEASLLRAVKQLKGEYVCND